MQGTRCVEQAADIAFAGFGPEPAGDPEVVPVAIVLPAALVGDGLEGSGR